MVNNHSVNYSQLTKNKQNSKKCSNKVFYSLMKKKETKNTLVIITGDVNDVFPSINYFYASSLTSQEKEIAFPSSY